MSISIGSVPQLNNYYKPQSKSNSAAQSANAANAAAQSANAANAPDKSNPNSACQTCKQRKYQDRSNDPGVSFKSPGHISPGDSSSVVASHEQEHVTNEQAKAKGEGRKVVSQSVVLHYAVCPECHKTYVSGGTTRTVTASDNKESSEPGNRLDVRF